MQSDLQMFSCITYGFWVIVSLSLLSDYRGIYPSFLILLTWYNFLHLNLWSIWSLFLCMMYNMFLILSFFPNGSPVTPALFTKKSTFISVIWCVTFFYILIFIYTWSISEHFILFHWFVYFVMCHYHNILVIEALSYVLISGINYQIIVPSSPIS